MNKVYEILEGKEIDKIEYVYPQHIQDQLDRLDIEICRIQSLCLAKIDSACCTTVHEELRIRQTYLSALAPLLSLKTRLIETSNPSIIIHCSSD